MGQRANPTDLELAALISSKICHDVIGPVGAIYNGLEILDEDDFMLRPRSSRIYYQGKFYDYPINVVNALKNLGPIEAIRLAKAAGMRLVIAGGGGGSAPRSGRSRTSTR